MDARRIYISSPARRLHPKIEEFDLLGSGLAVIGRDAENEPLFAETLSGIDLDPVRTLAGHALLDSVVALHRLRAVTCLYGFTRLEPAPTMSEALLEDVQLAVDGAPLAENADWLPAMEQRGEGIFLKIGSTAIRAWLGRDEVRARGDRLERGIARYGGRYSVEVERPGLPYVLLHSLAPIVFFVAGDPVALGLVTSLNRPSGNLTGTTTLTLEVGSKWLQLLHEVVPTANAFALLVNPTSPVLAEAQSRRSARRAGGALRGACDLRIPRVRHGRRPK